MGLRLASAALHDAVENYRAEQNRKTGKDPWAPIQLRTPIFTDFATTKGLTAIDSAMPLTSPNDPFFIIVTPFILRVVSAGASGAITPLSSVVEIIF